MPRTFNCHQELPLGYLFSIDLSLFFHGCLVCPLELGEAKNIQGLSRNQISLSLWLLLAVLALEGMGGIGWETEHNDLVLLCIGE